MRHPVDVGARQRLLEAQRSETDALRKVEAASKGCETARRRQAAADTKLHEAQRALARISGSARAAMLLGMDEATLRREMRRAEQTLDEPGQDPSPSPER